MAAVQKLALASSKGHDVHGGVSAGTAQSQSWHVEHKYCGKVGQGIASSLLQMSEHEETIEDTNQHTLRKFFQKIPERPNIYNIYINMQYALVCSIPGYGEGSTGTGTGGTITTSHVESCLCLYTSRLVSYCSEHSSALYMLGVRAS